MPFIVAAVGLLAVAILAALRPRQGDGSSSGTPPLERDTGAVSLTTASQREGEKAPEELPQDLLGLAGYIGGKLGEGLAFTNTGKAAALPIGVAVAGAATIATIAAGGALSVAAIWAIPVVLITANITAIVDAIARAAQAERWKQLCAAIAAKRASGDIPGAQALYEKAIAEVSGISRVWPQPRPIGLDGRPVDDALWPDRTWWNAADPLGRPYPGFPGLPAPATAAELAQWPHLMPEYVETVAGTPGEIASGEALPWLPAGRAHIPSLLGAFAQDVNDARAWGLANKVPGVVYGPGDPARAATDPRRFVTLSLATTGDRDIRWWPPLKERLVRLGELQTSLGKAVPWLSPGSFGVSNVITPYEAELGRRVIAANRAASDGTLVVVEGKVVEVAPGTSGAVSVKKVQAITRTTGLRGVAAVAMAQEVQAEAAALAAETKSGGKSSGVSGGAVGGGASSSGTGGSGGQRPSGGATSTASNREQEADAAERRGTGPQSTGGGTS